MRDKMSYNRSKKRELIMERISMAQKRVNRSADLIRSDFAAGASLKFLARKYEVSAEVIRRNLAEWGLISTEKDASRVRNTNPTFGRDQKSAGGSETK